MGSGGVVWSLIRCPVSPTRSPTLRSPSGGCAVHTSHTYAPQLREGRTSPLLCCLRTPLPYRLELPPALSPGAPPLADCRVFPAVLSVLCESVRAAERQLLFLWARLSLCSDALSSNRCRLLLKPPQLASGCYLPWDYLPFYFQSVCVLKFLSMFFVNHTRLDFSRFGFLYPSPQSSSFGLRITPSYVYCNC